MNFRWFWELFTLLILSVRIIWRVIYTCNKKLVPKIVPAEFLDPKYTYWRWHRRILSVVSSTEQDIQRVTASGFLQLHRQLVFRHGHSHFEFYCTYHALDLCVFSNLLPFCVYLIHDGECSAHLKHWDVSNLDTVYTRNVKW